MNSDYVLKGKGQIALHQPDWARFSPREATPASAPSASSSTAPAKASSSALPTKSPKEATVADTDTGNAQEARKTQFNNFTHSGSKKSVGPDVDTVDYTFEDFLDTINPLQQIPVVNMIYRHLSGDKISGVAQVMGSALFWGPTGIITGAVDAIFEQEKGGDMGETIMAGILGTETPNAKNLPSNNPIKHAPDTMLADAGKPEMTDEEAEAPVVIAEAEQAPLPKTAAKQPFGGIMGNETPAPVANIASKTAEPAPNSVATPPTQNIPVQHAPVETDGKKMYSLAGVIRHVGSPAKMPLHEVPDVRLKSYDTAAAKQKQLKQDPAALLGLQNPTASVANVPTLDDDITATRLPHPGFSAPLNMGSDGITPSGNPIPAQLIQDMMMMNMQKYQNDMQNGRLRGNGVDING